MPSIKKLPAVIWHWLSRRAKAIASAKPGMQPYLKQGWVFAYVVLVLLVDQLVLLANPQVGIYVNAAAFMALVGLALWKESARQLAISAAILPVATMVCLSLPPKTTPFNLLLVYYYTILLLALVYRYMFALEYPVRLTKLSLKGYGMFVPAMLVVGQVLGGIGYLLLQHHYPFDRHLMMTFIVFTSIIFAIAEETLFRGLIQQRAMLVLHPVAAALLSTLLFTIATIGLNNASMVVFALISGAVYSTVYFFKQNLVLTVTANAMTKLAYLSLLGIFVFR